MYPLYESVNSHYNTFHISFKKTSNIATNIVQLKIYLLSCWLITFSHSSHTTVSLNSSRISTAFCPIAKAFSGLSIKVIILSANFTSSLIGTKYPLTPSFITSLAQKEPGEQFANPIAILSNSAFDKPS